jgi:hypothetical protein
MRVRVSNFLLYTVKLLLDRDGSRRAECAWLRFTKAGFLNGGIFKTRLR